MDKDCIFCKIIAGDIPSEKVYEDDKVYAFRDINPCAPTHILIVPKRHIPRTIDLTQNDAALVGKLILTANKLAADEGIAEPGCRYVFNCNKNAGQEVFHIHLHLIGGRKLSWPPG
jgi:histidine triad (HIT) family protein